MQLSGFSYRGTLISSPLGYDYDCTRFMTGCGGVDPLITMDQRIILCRGLLCVYDNNNNISKPIRSYNTTTSMASSMARWQSKVAECSQRSLKTISLTRRQSASSLWAAVHSMNSSDESHLVWSLNGYRSTGTDQEHEHLTGFCIA